MPLKKIYLSICNAVLVINLLQLYIIPMPVFGFPITIIYCNPKYVPTLQDLKLVVLKQLLFMECE